MKLKNALLSITTLFVLSCNNNTQSKIDTFKYKDEILRGDIKRITYTVYKGLMQNGEILQGDEKFHTSEFEGAHKLIVEFDKNHNTLSENYYDTLGNHTVESIYEYKDSLLISINRDSKTKEYKDRITHEYDRNNRLVELRKINLIKNSVWDRYLYEYEGNSNKPKSEKWFPETDHIVSTYYTYNDKEQVITKKVEQSGTYTKYIYEYNDFDSVYKEIFYSMYSLEGIESYFGYRLYEYDNIKRLISSKQYTSEDKLYSEQTYSYDEYNNLLKSYVLNHDENGFFKNMFFNYTYKYDELGNWIFKSVSYNERLEYVILREIEYK